MAKNNKTPINKGGRPSKLTEDTTKKLESILKIGGTVEEACSYAGITTPTFYGWQQQNDSFLAKMNAARHYADVAAKNVVVRAITEDDDLQTAKWWLEKREFRDAPQSLTQINIKPILGGASVIDVQTSNSNQETSKAKEKD